MPHKNIELSQLNGQNGLLSFESSVSLMLKMKEPFAGNRGNLQGSRLNAPHRVATQTTHALKSVSSSPKPSAPPVYRPQQAAPALQPKMSMAPPVYRPTAVQRMQPPPVYRPNTIQRMSAPSVYHPQSTPVMTKPRPVSARPMAFSQPVQATLHKYVPVKGGLIDDITVDDAAGPGKMKLTSSNSKVNGSLEYRQKDQKTTLKTVNAFPQGYGLGAILLYHLGEKAIENGSKVIDIGAPALTEMGFYLQLGASFTTSNATKDMQDNLLINEDARQSAREALASAAALKEWDSGKYFEGAVDKRLSALPEEDQRNIIKDRQSSVKSGEIDQYLINRGSYLTSEDGLMFRDLSEFMKKSSKSVSTRWKKIESSNCCIS